MMAGKVSTVLNGILLREVDYGNRRKENDSATHQNRVVEYGDRRAVRSEFPTNEEYIKTRHKDILVESGDRFRITTDFYLLDWANVIL